jgi:hypothetical protein
LQRSRRRPKGREDHCGASCSTRRSAGRTGSARQERRSDDLRGRQYKHIDRQGHVQRPWWRTESNHGGAGKICCLERARRHSGRGRSSSRCDDSAGTDRRQVNHRDQLGAHR